MTVVRSIGTVDDTDILEVTICSQAGARAKIMTWGAVVRDLVVPSRGGPQRVVLGLTSLDDYLHHSPHFGAIAGRFANRLAHGRYAIDGASFDSPRNEGGVTSLHGGGHGFGKRPWVLADHGANHVRLTLRSEAGDAGYPGALEVTCLYHAGRTLDAARRADGNDRCGDHHQPRASLLFQPRWIARHSCPRSDPRRALLYACRCPPHPDRRNPDGRRYRLRFSHRAAHRRARRRRGLRS